jgi:DNA-binding XRE family transcriptional regulator
MRSEELIKIRQERGKTQKEVALFLGISKKGIHR